MYMKYKNYLDMLIGYSDDGLFKAGIHIAIIAVSSSNSVDVIAVER